MFARLGTAVVRRRRAVVLAWLALVALGAVAGGGVFDHLEEASGQRPDSESAVTQERLDRLEDNGPELLAFLDGRPVTDPGLTASVRAAAAALRATPGVVEVDDAYDSPGPWAADDLRSSLVRVELARGLAPAAQERLVAAVRARLEAIDAPTVLVGGEEIAEEEFAAQAVRDLARGELIALPVLVVVLLLAFGGVVAAGVPLLVALAAIACTLLALLGLAAVVPVSEYSVNVVTLLGLGLAVDYSLVMVARFREERASDPEVAAAVVRTVASAGRTVCCSGLTVAAALSGLLVFAEPLLRSMALAGVTVVVVAMLAALTLVPALLALVGARIGAARPGAARQGALAAVARRVQRRPAPVAAALALGLAVLAVPFAHVHLADSGPEALPRTAAARQLDAALADRFGRTRADPVVVLADTPAGTREFVDFLNQADALDGVRQVVPRDPLPGGVQVVDVVPDGATAGPAALRVVDQVRALDPPFPVAVTGTAASLADYRASVAARLPFAAVVMVLASFVLLFLLTGSVVVPVKAIAMNLLSLGASLGVLVWVFQDGHLAGLLGFEAVGSVDLTIPVLLVVFTFGLSMDYEVFLLARIKEEWDATGDNQRAVALGLERAGPVVTAAAVCIVAVFLGFAFGELLPVKAMGVGMIVAVVLDATVVRVLLVPATMTLLGRWNWWAPARLRRLHARLGVAAPPTRPVEPVGSRPGG